MWQAEMQRQLQKEREEQLRLMQHHLQVDTHAHITRDTVIDVCL